MAKTVTDMAEVIKQHPIRIIIKKNFRGNLHTGTVTIYNNKHELCWIDYEDGDNEELYHKQVTQFKCTNSLDRARTRFTRSALANFVTKI